MAVHLDIESQNNIHNYKVLVTGSTGFIGSRLVSELTKRGYSVRAMSRKQIRDTDNVQYIKADIFNENQLNEVMSGVEVAYYLLHSMEGTKDHWKEFDKRERIQAQNFLKTATKNGVKRIIYLGGLVNDSLDLSPHMKSRKEVGEILSSGSIPVTELRASLIIGAHGGSYAMLRYLVERLRIMVCPKWVKSLSQPIALDDVISYLIGCLEQSETIGKIFEIGGPDKITYEELMRIYSAYLNKNLFILQIPFLTTSLSSYWVDLITPVKASLARPLIDSLVHDTVVKDDSIMKIIPLKLKSVREAIDIATKEMKSSCADNSSKEERTGFKINQRILIYALVFLVVIGSSYYWLDNRSDVYHPLWILSSIMWYVTIIAALILVNNKTRLGYLISGILSWITLVFWSLDNFYVVFDATVIAAPPSDQVMIRNFIGIGIAIIAVVASHNLFHKVIGYQRKGWSL